MHALVIGCGYLGRRVAAIWRLRGDRVSALTRSPENAAALQAEGIDPIVGDVLDPASLRNLPSADAVLYAVGFDKTASATKREVYVTGLENVLREIGPRVGRLVYISSTSVYGQDAGEWIDETSICTPSTEDGRICLAAEQMIWRFFPSNSEAAEPVPSPRSDRACGANVLRFSGIYGPGRLLRRIESVRGGEVIRANPEGFLNLIHVDDGARIVTELAERGRSGATYLVTDDQPIRRREYYTLLARSVGAPAPVFQDDREEAHRLNKRCSNARVRSELGDVFKFPTCETGLADAIA